MLELSFVLLIVEPMSQGTYHGTLIAETHSGPHLAQMAALIVLVNTIAYLASSEALGEVLCLKRKSLL